jgi:hypothetical protein
VQSIKLSEKTVVKAEKANTFLTGIGNISVFIIQLFKETFSSGFELQGIFTAVFSNRE